MKKLIKLGRPIIIFGQRLYWYIFRPATRGAKIILVNDNYVLLVKPTYGYKFTLPGGGIKKDETPEGGVLREIKEELNLNLDQITYLGSFISEVEYKKDTVYCFFAELKTRDITSTGVEIDTIQWFSINDLPTLGPISKKIFDLYSQYK